MNKTCDHLVFKNNSEVLWGCADRSMRSKSCGVVYFVCLSAWSHPFPGEKSLHHFTVSRYAIISPVHKPSTHPFIIIWYAILSLIIIHWSTTSWYAISFISYSTMAQTNSFWTECALNKVTDSFRTTEYALNMAVLYNRNIETDAFCILMHRSIRWFLFNN